MKKRTSDYSSDTEQQRAEEDFQGCVGKDLYQLRQPGRATYQGFQEAKEAFESGSNEIRELLVNECSLIYECNVCRSLFRSLTNFLSHKRTFCCHTSDGSNFSGGYKDQQKITIKGVESQAINMKSEINTNVVSLSGKNFCMIDVTNVEDDNIQDGGRKNEIMDVSLQCDRANVIKTEEMDEVDQSKITIEIDDDVEEATENNEKIECTTETSLSAHSCDACNAKFSTKELLNLHMQKKHLPSSSTTCTFQCPSCSLTFAQPAAVIRHLANEHKKPVRHIKMMRETVLKRHLQADDAHVKSRPSRELKRLDNNVSENECGVGQKKIMSTCVYCEKSFERRAALSTHLLHCRVKQAALGKPLPPLQSVRKRLKSHSSEFACVIKQEDIKVEKGSKDDSEADLLNEMFAHLGSQSFGAGLKTVSLDKLDLSEGETNEVSASMGLKADAEGHVDLKERDFNGEMASNNFVGTMVKDEDVEESLESFNEENKIKLEIVTGDLKKAHRRFRTVRTEKSLSCRCKICNKHFNALSNLRRHISMFHYKARRFGCKLCEYRAFRRYDIVNHLGFVHKMTGEREVMSTEYVSVHEVHYTKDDVEGDIVLVTDEKETISTTGQYGGKTSKMRNKMMISASDGNVSDGMLKCKSKRQRLKRSHSQVEGVAKTLQRRPIRNRIKAENKDFVYDLSNLLNNDAQGMNQELMCTLKRRNTVCNLGDVWLSDESIYGDSSNAFKEPLIVSARKELIKGAAQRISSHQVSQGNAASSTQPELPAERPQMRPRVVSSNRADVNGVPVIETMELEAARLKSTLLDDTFLEKIAKRSTVAFKIKPCLALQQSALSMLLEKVDSSLHRNASKLNGGEALSKDRTAVDRPGDGVVLPRDTLHLRSANGKYFIEPQPSIPILSSPPPTPKKRITLIECLTENKTKYRESLLRSALEN